MSIKTKITALTALVLVASGVACGKSPLRHHTTAKSPQSNAPAPTSNDPASASPGETLPNNCPILFARSNVCASVEWTTAINSQDEASFDLKFWTKDQGNSTQGPFAKPSSIVFVKLWMTSMGHGSSPTLVSEVSEGVYRVSRVNFIMAGPWDIRLQLRTENPTTIIDEATISLDVE
jgi:hypothetical protein